MIGSSGQSVLTPHSAPAHSIATLWWVMFGVACVGFTVVAVLLLLGWIRRNRAAQPDWYLGWLIGALRLIPSFDVTIGNYTLVPNPFWGGAAFPLFVFLVLFLWPSLERRVTGDYAFHNLLDRPRVVPWRTAIGVAFFTRIFVVFLAGAADRMFVLFGLSYQAPIWGVPCAGVGVAGRRALRHEARLRGASARRSGGSAAKAGRGRAGLGNPAALQS